MPENYSENISGNISGNVNSGNNSGNNSGTDRETPAHLILFYPAIFLPGNKTETITSKQRQKPLHELFDSSKNWQ